MGFEKLFHVENSKFISIRLGFFFILSLSPIGSRGLLKTIWYSTPEYLNLPLKF